MSETTTTTPPVDPTRAQAESLWSQSFIYAMAMLPIAAGVVAASFVWLDKQVASTIAAMAIPMLLAPSAFFFGAAKHPQNSSTVPPAGTTQTLTTTPTPVTTTTETHAP